MVLPPLVLQEPPTHSHTKYRAEKYQSSELLYFFAVAGREGAVEREAAAPTYTNKQHTANPQQQAALRASDRANTMADEDEGSMLPPTGLRGVVVRRIASLLVRRSCLVWLVCLSVMTGATYVQFKGGRFAFQDGWKYDLFVAWDPIVMQQEAAFQAVWRPHFQLLSAGYQIETDRYVYHATLRNWWDARDACDAAGQVLASVTSIEQNLGISALATGNLGQAWLGAADSMPIEGEWHWLKDGKTFPPTHNAEHPSPRGASASRTTWAARTA